MYFIKNRLLIISLISVLLWATGSPAGEPVKPTGKERCPVCGMFTNLYPKWISQMVFRDGSYELFDGPKDMLRYYFNMAKYTKSRTRDDIVDIFVTEYYSTQLIGTDGVYFIKGSDVLGPMGVEMVPVKGKKQAAEFMRDHGGQQMLSFAQLTLADVPGIN